MIVNIKLVDVEINGHLVAFGVEAGVLEYCTQHMDIMTPLPQLLVAHGVKGADLAVEIEIRLECIS